MGDDLRLVPMVVNSGLVPRRLSVEVVKTGSSKLESWRLSIWRLTNWR